MDCIPAVAWSQRQVEELAWSNPRERGVLQASRLTCDVHAEKLNLEIGAGIGDRVLDLADSRDLDAEFFVKLTANSVKRSFPGLNFAAWELPQAPVPLVRWTLA
jgi:hypothetical protein